MNFKDAMVDVLRDLFSWLKDQNDKENIEFLVTLIGCLAFIFVPVVIPVVLIAYFKVTIAIYYLIMAVFIAFWLFYSYQVIVKWVGS